MTISTPLVIRRFLSALSGRITLVSLILGLVWLGWIGWQAWEQWQDQVLPPDRVSAKQLRVTEGQRQTLEQALTEYRNPAKWSTPPAISFETVTR